jgi:hypothetical protein
MSIFYETKPMKIGELSNHILRLPLDIIINHILPYTYNTKDREHLLDIRTFVSDCQFMKSLYYDYNEIIILNDLVRYCNNNVAPLYGLHKKYENILRRYTMFQTKTSGEIHDYVFGVFHRRILENTERRILFLFGLLTPRERSDFFNVYYVNA